MIGTLKLVEGKIEVDMARRRIYLLKFSDGSVERVFER